MFNYKRTGPGVINGKWVVFFIDDIKEEINMCFCEEEYQAFEKAEYFNNIVKSFIKIIKQS
jgi:hypothetical protein